MNLSKRYVVCTVFLLNFHSALCGLTQAWDRFLAVSCEFSSDVEKFIPIEHEDRLKRSVFEHKEPNFDDPQELFDYLYPMAHIKKEDVLLEAQRSSSAAQLNPIYAWAKDLGHLWLSDCKSRNVNNKENENEPRSRTGTSAPRRRRSALVPDSHGQGSTHNRTKVKGQRRSGLVTPTERKISTSKTNTTTTEAPPTTTTADPGASDDNFFSSYGGDIEYFFPLISFGIPFDGEITFLGFHGFKGLFPY